MVTATLAEFIEEAHVIEGYPELTLVRDPTFALGYLTCECRGEWISYGDPVGDPRNVSGIVLVPHRS